VVSHYLFLLVNRRQIPKAIKSGYAVNAAPMAKAELPNP
jgi:hypothetical protein